MRASRIVGCLLLGLMMAVAPVRAASFRSLEVVSKSGVHVFSVEIADTPEKRTQGLMFVKHLPDGQGMLFDFGTPKPAYMWMKDTFVSLDMIFIAADGRILNIARRTTPQSLDAISSAGPAKGVLEILGGLAGRLGINAGDRVEHRMFE